MKEMLKKIGDAVVSDRLMKAICWLMIIISAIGFVRTFDLYFVLFLGAGIFILRKGF